MDKKIHRETHELLESAPEDSVPRFTRREFCVTTTVGTGALVAATTTGCGTAQRPKTQKQHKTPKKPMEGRTEVTLRINAREHRQLVEPRWTLLHVLRNHLGLTGTKVGCERGECGACTVLLDDKPHYACMLLAVDVEGREITTLEGLLDGEDLGDVQKAFAEEDALQCGYCTPGQIMAIEGLLRQDPSPGDAQIRRGMSGNLCRCGTYPHIKNAAHRAAKLRAGRSTKAGDGGRT